MKAKIMLCYNVHENSLSTYNELPSFLKPVMLQGQ